MHGTSLGISGDRLKLLEEAYEVIDRTTLLKLAPRPSSCARSEAKERRRLEKAFRRSLAKPRDFLDLKGKGRRKALANFRNQFGAMSFTGFLEAFMESPKDKAARLEKERIELEAQEAEREQKRLAELQKTQEAEQIRVAKLEDQIYDLAREEALHITLGIDRDDIFTDTDSGELKVRLPANLAADMGIESISRLSEAFRTIVDDEDLELSFLFNGEDKTVDLAKRKLVVSLVGRCGLGRLLGRKLEGLSFNGDDLMVDVDGSFLGLKNHKRLIERFKPFVDELAKRGIRLGFNTDALDSISRRLRREKIYKLAVKNGLSSKLGESFSSLRFGLDDKLSIVVARDFLGFNNPDLMMNKLFYFLKACQYEGFKVLLDHKNL